MAHYQVTADGEVLQQLFLRGNGLARSVGQVLNLLEAQGPQRSSKLKPYERTEARQGYRGSDPVSFLPSGARPYLIWVPPW